MIVVVKFNETANFGLWQKMMKDLLVQQGLMTILFKKTKKSQNMTNEGSEYNSAMSSRRVKVILLFLSQIFN